MSRWFDELSLVYSSPRDTPDRRSQPEAGDDESHRSTSFNGERRTIHRVSEQDIVLQGLSGRDQRNVTMMPGELK
jgi:hypothetical protein